MFKISKFIILKFHEIKFFLLFQDINECETDSKNICGNGICVNNIGSYTCQCDDGYSIKGEGNLYCFDVDECMLGTHRCDKNSICINNPV